MKENHAPPESLFATPPAPPAPAWTENQQQVIEHLHGDLLVSAAAGSGKTAVLAQRCARLVTRDKEAVDVNSLLVLTFTDAAANEMRTRIAAALRKKIAGLPTAAAQAVFAKQAANVERAAVSTLHQFCARTLRAYFHEAQIDPAFEVIDQEEAQLLQDDVMDTLLARWHSSAGPEAEAFANFYERYAQGEDQFVKHAILSLHNMLASVENPEQWLHQAVQDLAPHRIAATFSRYAQQVSQDLELKAARAFRHVAQLEALEFSSMAAPIQNLAHIYKNCATQLSASNGDDWDNCRSTLKDAPWPASLRCPKQVDNDHWNAWKDSTYTKHKSDVKDLLKETFAPNKAQLIADLKTLLPPLETLISLTRQFQHAFTAAKRAENRLDFSDLEQLTYKLLSAPHSPAANDLRQRYHHVLVDEFQDINPLQLALLMAVRKNTPEAHAGNLFVVGDVKQSIYGFRLADPNLFLQREAKLKKITTYPAAIALPHNFRSQPHLLSHMNAIFSHLLTPEVAGVNYLDGHALRSKPGTEHQTNGTPIELHLLVEEEKEKAGDDEDQAQPAPEEPETPELSTDTQREATVVAQRIQQLMAEGKTIVDRHGSQSPLKFGHIAILLRSMKPRAHVFARVLAENGIPVHASLSTGYFEAQEVRDVIALLEALDNPFQDIPLATVLLGPFGNFSHDDLALIRLAFKNSPAPNAEKIKDLPFHRVVHAFAAGEGAEKIAAHDLTHLRQRLQTFLAKLDHFRSLTRTLGLHEALAQIYQESHLLTYAAGLPGATQRVANLQMLHHRALQFSSFRKQGLFRFLKFIRRLKDNNSDLGPAPVLSEAADVVRIMSIHNSKGLEFPVVVVANLGGKFNLQSTHSPILIDRDQHIGLHVADLEKNVFYPSVKTAAISRNMKRAARAEELRLLYVALTRARDHLILTGVTRKNAIANARQMWQSHRGPLPEDILVSANKVLDWLLPTAACADVQTTWPDHAVANPQIAVTEHAAVRASAKPPAPPTAGNIPQLLLSRQPLNVQLSPATQTAVQEVVERITRPYPYQPLTQLPALMSVTELKKQSSVEEEIAPVPAEDFPALTLTLPRFGESPNPSQISQASPDRGIATHKLLELLDFSMPPDAPALESQIQTLIAARHLTMTDAALINRQDLLWFLNHPIAQRLRAPASAQPPAALYRELPFTFTLPPSHRLPASIAATLPELRLTNDDRPEIRGIIDLLLISENQVEIFDYKTDAPSAIPQRLESYRRQMSYYAQAVQAILGKPVARATLVFLAAQSVFPIDNPALNP